MTIEIRSLKPKRHYWAHKVGSDELEIVRISTIFGEDPEFHTTAVMGSDEHHDLGDFEYLTEIATPLVIYHNDRIMSAG